MKTNQSIRQHIIAADSPHRNQPADFTIHGSGTVFLFEPLTESAKSWLHTHCPADGEHQYLGRNLAVEFRYIADIIRLAIWDGLIQLVEGGQ